MDSTYSPARFAQPRPVRTPVDARRRSSRPTDGSAARAEIVWAALDCPTSAPIANDPGDEEFRPVVLARLAVRVLARFEAGETYTIVSWPVAFDGRKRHAGAALYSLDGEVLAVSRALWIELKP